MCYVDFPVHFFPKHPGVCPGCGRCGTCGRGRGLNPQPYWRYDTTSPLDYINTSRSDNVISVNFGTNPYAQAA